MRDCQLKDYCGFSYLDLARCLSRVFSHLFEDTSVTKPPKPTPNHADKVKSKIEQGVFYFVEENIH